MGQGGQGNNCLQNTAHFATKNKLLHYKISF